jgi:hypothetical protein
MRLPHPHPATLILTLVMRHPARIKDESSGGSCREQSLTSILEFVTEVAKEAEGVGRENFGGCGADGGVDFDLDGSGAGFHCCVG